VWGSSHSSNIRTQSIRANHEINNLSQRGKDDAVGETTLRDVQM
jgi:hypothetical protein